MACPDCFRGTISESTPIGTITTLHNLPTYIANPPEGTTLKGVIVFIPDAFGWEFVNNRVLCDQYAKRVNAIVYLPDFMNGKACPVAAIPLMEKITTPSSWVETLFYKPWYIIRAASMMIPFMIQNRPAITKPRIFSFIQALRTSAPPFPTGNLKIGAAGFCWGGKFTTLLAHDTPSSRVVVGGGGELRSLIDAAFMAHPSMLSVPGDIEQIRIPMSVSVGDVDMAMPKKDAERMKEILEVKLKGDHECVILKDAKHGFAVRMNRKDEHQLDCGMKAEDQAVEWFKRWFTSC